MREEFRSATVEIHRVGSRWHAIIYGVDWSQVKRRMLWFSMVAILISGILSSYLWTQYYMTRSFIPSSVSEVVDFFVAWNQAPPR